MEYKTHLKGTNGRFVCGARITNISKVRVRVELSKVTCITCLFRHFGNADAVNLFLESVDLKAKNKELHEFAESFFNWTLVN